MANEDADDLGARFRRDGFAFPIRVMPEEEAAECLKELEEAEASTPASTLHRCLNGYSHLALPFVARLARDPRVTDAVAACLGSENLLAKSAQYFPKEVGSGSFVEWHQDTFDEIYNRALTAWIALTPSTRRSGCLSFIPGSHATNANGKEGLGASTGTDGVDNNNDDDGGGGGGDGGGNARGEQPIGHESGGPTIGSSLDTSKAVHGELRPGEMSLHHGRTFHCTGSNESSERRLGVAIRFIPPDNCQQGAARPWAMLSRGVDTVGHYELLEPPEKNASGPGIDDKDVARIQGVIDANNNFASLYAAKFR